MKIHAALFACLLGSALCLSACSNVGKCTRGELDCACTTDKTCAAGLSCNQTTNRCATAACPRGELGCACMSGNACNGSLTCESNKCIARTGGAGNGGGKSDAGTKTDAGTRSDAGTKSDAGTGKKDAGMPVPIDCTDTSFEAACRGYCMAFCQNEQLLCSFSQCDPGDCEPNGALYPTCSTVCGANDAACLKELCMRQGQRTCEDFGFEDQTTHVFQAGCFHDDPNCVVDPDYGCSDTCGATTNSLGFKVDGTLAKNGKCEDGGKTSTAATCPRGTDCTDCGMRTCASSLGTCANNGDCCGYYSGKSLCVKVATGPVCLATCSVDTDCATGQTCRTAMDDQMKSFHVCSQ